LKSVWSRWLNEPLSPLARLFVTFLLVLLGILVQGVLSSLEMKIRERVENSGVRNIMLVHRVTPEKRLENDLFMISLKELTGQQSKLIEFKRLTVQAKFGSSRKSLPVFSYDPDEWRFFSFDVQSSDNQAYFFSHNIPYEEPVHLSINNLEHGHVSVRAMHTHVPIALKKLVNLEQFLLIPKSLESNFSQSGFQSFKVIEVEDIDAITPLVHRLENLFRLDRKNIQIIDQRSLLEELNNVYRIQAQWRLGVALMISVVLTLLIGSTALLEFRQNQYVIALLKSFGVSSYYVAFAFLLENICLVFLGILLATLVMVSVSAHALQMIAHSFKMEAVHWVFSFADLNVLIVASFIGVTLALVPIFRSLKKPVGRVLQ